MSPEPIVNHVRASELLGDANWLSVRNKHQQPRSKSAKWVHRRVQG